MHKNQNWNSLSRELVNGRNINGALMEYDVNGSNIMIGPSSGVFDLPTLYGYRYDNINRLKTADAVVGDFIQPDSLALESRMIGDVTLLYDRIGNIKSLHRTLRNDYDTVGAPYTKIQHFNYLYGNGNNRLNYAQGVGGTTTRAYTYDVNGNLRTDDSKDLLVKEYGRASYAFELEVDSAKVSYLYNSNDQRIYKRHTEGMETTENYYLVNAMGQTVAIFQKSNTYSGWEYYASGAEREARLIPDANQSPGFNDSINMGYSSPEETHFGSQMVTFFLYDHLGNTRVTYTPRSISADSLSLSLNNLNYIADYFPYGKVLREYVGTDKERYLTTQHERDEETDLDYRIARLYDSDVARFLSLDEMQNQRMSLTPYNYVSGNPIMRTDPDGRLDDEFDKDGKKISNLGGEKVDFHHQEGGDTKVVDRETGESNIIKGGENLIRGYKQRHKDIGWKDIFDEWDFGVGPEKSILTDFYNMNQGPFGSLDSESSSYASLARKAALNSSDSKGLVKMNYNDANPAVAEDMWEQMWGRTNISWYKLGDDKVLFMMTDTKSFTSWSYRMFPSWDRSTFKPNGTTYQTYLWTESMVEIMQKVQGK